MWLFNSSVGRKVVMSVTGVCLILFLTFHCAMNVVALFSGDAYNTICALLGSNWYAIAGTLGLAALAVIHIVYAFILTAQNRRARGDNRYEVSTRVNPGHVEWASKNMLVLGLIILLGLLLHLFNFWYNMMFAEIVGAEKAIGPTDGFGWIVYTFSNPVYVVLYLVWIAAIWFHLTHGFWSAMQTLGLSGKTWLCRWKWIGGIYVTLLMLCFAVVVLAFAFKCAPSLCKAGDCCKAQTECVMQQDDCQQAGHCDKAMMDCCKGGDSQDAAAKACQCGEACQCDPCQCGEGEACQCDPCQCEDCQCGKGEACQCDPCQCDPCQCAKK